MQAASMGMALPALAAMGQGKRCLLLACPYKPSGLPVPHLTMIDMDMCVPEGSMAQSVPLDSLPNPWRSFEAPRLAAQWQCPCGTSIDMR